MVRVPLSVLLLVVAQVGFGQARLLKDIGSGSTPVSSNPISLATVGRYTFFIARGNGTGTELWKTDGTAPGTSLVRDFAPGPASGMPAFRLDSRAVGSRLVFVNGDAEHGVECWVSDGTDSGTHMLLDINPGPEDGEVRLGLVAGSLLYFTAYSPESGRELWRTDGTPEGTRIVVDLLPGLKTSSPTVLASLGNRLVFSGTNGADTGLFVTNETGNDAEFIASHAGEFGTTLGAHVLFAVPDVSRKLWTLMRTDGTGAGTVVLRSGLTADYGMVFAPGDRIAYFLAGVVSNELWRTDGTPAGTTLVKAAIPGRRFIQIKTIGDRAIFVTDLAGGQLWSSDGTPSMTSMLREAGISDGVVYDGHFYFASRDPVHGWEVWRTDGTAAGTAVVRDIWEGASDGLVLAKLAFVARPDGVMFAASRPETGNEPWISDGTAEGTRMIRNVAQDDAWGSTPSMLTQVRDRIVFFTPDGPLGSTATLWSSDGTDAGTMAIQTVETLPVHSASSGDLLYFVAGDPQQLVLWRTDGTVSGTWRLHRSPQRMQSLQPWRNGLFFHSRDAEQRERPFFTDGTVNGTRVIADIEPQSPTVAGDWVYFGARTTSYVRPWRTDGTPAGTVPLPINGTSAHSGSQATAFTVVGEWVYFVANSSTGGFELWRSHLASGQTSLVTMVGGIEGPRVMFPVGNLVVFRLHSGWWRSDGTAAGTYLFSADAAPMFCQFPGAGVATAERVFYWYGGDYYSAGGWVPTALWRTDGTAAGTYPLAPMGTPSSSSGKRCEVNGLFYSKGRLFFHGLDPSYGGEPWVTDGTSAGTRMLTDLNPSYLVSNPGSFLISDKTLYFTAQRQDTGDEVWMLCLEDCGVRRRVARQ